MDDDKDSIALRMKRNDRRINHQSDGDDDDNSRLRILDFERESVMEGTREWMSFIYIYILFTGSKILLNQ